MRVHEHRGDTGSSSLGGSLLLLFQASRIRFWAFPSLVFVFEASTVETFPAFTAADDTADLFGGFSWWLTVAHGSCAFCCAEPEDGPSIDGLSTSPRASMGETLPLPLLHWQRVNEALLPSLTLGSACKSA